MSVNGFKFNNTVHKYNYGSLENIPENFAPEYMNNTAYAVGDYCTHNHILYRCTTQIAGETWNASHWTSVDIAVELKNEVSDLKSAIEEIEPGLSDEAKEALLACFANVAWINEHGQDYYDALENALYNRSGDWDYEWSASSGVAPTGFQSNNIVFSNNSMIADDPVYSIGYSDIDIEIEMVWDTVVQGHTQSTQLLVSEQAHHGAKMYVNGTNLIVAYGDNNGDTVNETTDIDFSEYHVYRLTLNNGVFTFYVDGSRLFTGKEYLSLYNKMPFISDISSDYSGNPTKLGIKAIRWKRLGTATNEKRLKVYNGKGVDSNGDIVDNTNRAITEPLPFSNTAPITVKIVGAIAQGIKCAPKVVGTNGKVWTYNSSVDAYNINFVKAGGNTGVMFIETNDEYTVKAYINNTWVVRPFPNTNGTIRFLFASIANPSSPLPAVPSGSLFINGEEYILEEG